MLPAIEIAEVPLWENVPFCMRQEETHVRSDAAPAAKQGKQDRGATPVLDRLFPTEPAQRGLVNCKRSPRRPPSERSAKGPTPLRQLLRLRLPARRPLPSRSYRGGA